MDLELRDTTTRAGTLRYAVGGDRPADAANPDARRPVVLLHPWFGSWRFWYPSIAAITPGPWLAVDFYSLAAGGTTLGPLQLADTVLDLLDAEGLPVVDVVGNSVGGIVAQVLASADPLRVHRLALVGTGARTEGTLPGFKAEVDRWAETSDVMDPIAIGRVVDLLATRPIPADIRAATIENIAATPREFIAGVLRGARELDLRPRLAAISAPTLVIRGELDCARTPAHVAELLAGLPRATSVEMAGAGHSPMLDEPAEFGRLVAGHLAGSPVGSPALASGR